MATLTFSFETGAISVNRIIDGMAASYGYKANIRDPQTGQIVPNPQTKAQFAKAQIKRLIIEAVHNAETLAARQAFEVTVEPIDIT